MIDKEQLRSVSRMSCAWTEAVMLNVDKIELMHQ